MRQDMIRILQDTLQIMEHGSYSVNNKTVNLKLSRKEMETVQVLLPKDVQDICCRTDLKKSLLRDDVNLAVKISIRLLWQSASIKSPAVLFQTIQGRCSS